jgi:hypothetical protein
VFIKDIGASLFSSSFWVSTATKDWSEAKVYRKNTLLKSRLHNTGAWEMEVLMLLKAPYFSSSHLNSLSLQIIPCNGLMVSAKSGVNFLTKLIFPKKYCMAFLL